MNWINLVIGIGCVAAVLFLPPPRRIFGLSSKGWVRLTWIMGIANLILAFIPVP